MSATEARARSPLITRHAPDRFEDWAMKPFTRLAIVVSVLIALAHLYRLIRPFDVVLSGSALPQWASVVGVIIAAGLALMLWREARP
ncbi:hypothetical protein D3876_06600 [Sphingomonas cavernae]|uniref:Uncharacterized protein n=2 Tax=Sphingomonas cavernae TaxID=2320861 RepID=A0A418WRW3_9SPHN|nr:hypothetical protein D3876_06600 [Sphingomonas cavernae]